MRYTSPVERYKFIELIHAHVGQMMDVSSCGAKTIRYYPLDIERFARRLMRYGATLGRIAENQCNGYEKHLPYSGVTVWDEEASKRDEAKEERIKVKVSALCKTFGCKPVFQGDPRGNTLKVQVPDGYTNDWGREGICVPTS